MSNGRPVFTTAMITRSRASYVNGPRPACPVKFEVPVQRCAESCEPASRSAGSMTLPKASTSAQGRS